MPIIGLGTDIVEIDRIPSHDTKAGERLAQRVLTPTELDIYKSSSQPQRYLAKRFAAKEAAAKALGTGIGRGVSFQHIHVSNNEDGAPQLTFSDGALEEFKSMSGCSLHLSIADEKRYAVATVILES
ncbi:holo-ACP synthase [Parashewanella curva]|uniref:Holo-[acyl-carrier-protein] synthase n=1 Tax=Parashewanella curva TaxID=2338552 RepID=A0A3L8PS71_9GAMM|nr:holo-ACP synthase [Parashewanella curva]RLV58267.1 holo-ACP synthase [Parashewanella curva]